MKELKEFINEKLHISNYKKEIIFDTMKYYKYIDDIEEIFNDISTFTNHTIANNIYDKIENQISNNILKTPLNIFCSRQHKDYVDYLYNSLKDYIYQSKSLKIISGNIEVDYYKCKYDKIDFIFINIDNSKESKDPIYYFIFQDNI